MLEHAAVITRGLARCIAGESRLSGGESTALRADTREILADALRQFATALRARPAAALVCGGLRRGNGTASFTYG